MIAQWAKGLEEPVQKSGCLMLCYLWAGWLYSLGGRRMQETAFPTVDTINESYDFLRHYGAVGEDCFVRKPEEVIAFPWHYWDGSNLRGEEPRVTVEKIPPLHRGHVWPLSAVGDGRVPPPMNAMVVDVTRWQHGPSSHFTAICQRPAGYFDPWVVSSIAQSGTPRSVRRVTLSK